MRFEWDEAKNRSNLLKHRISFETAVLAFDDPFALTRRDEFVTEEERWITLGSVSRGAVLFMVHTRSEEDDEEGTRIISARRATPRERKTMRKLSAEQKRDIAAISAMKDEDIDLSDMPEVLDWSGAEMGRFYRPPKRSVTIRLDGDVLDWLKGYGKGYQTRVNLLLRHAMASATAQKTTEPRRQKSKRARA